MFQAEENANLQCLNNSDRSKVSMGGVQLGKARAQRNLEVGDENHTTQAGWSWTGMTVVIAQIP